MWPFNPKIKFLDDNEVNEEDVRTKLVVSDVPAEELPDYECVNCHFESNDKQEAIKHQQETKPKMHEMWVKRKME